jgi:hypothetical protein
MKVADQVQDRAAMSEREWREKLTPEQYHVLREAGTEPPFAGRYVNNHDEGEYRCAGCGELLFDSDHQVRQRQRLAELHRAGGADGERACRHEPRHAPGRGALREVRRPSRPPLPRRAGADRAALLHQQRSLDFKGRK